MSVAKKSLVVGEHFDTFIDRQIASGCFNNASEVVRAGLRLLENEEAKLEELRRMIAEGDAELDAGLGIPIDEPGQLAALIKAGGRKRLAEG